MSDVGDPDLTWTGPKEAFYFDIRLSKDPNFNKDPKTAVAPVYQEIIDGGVTKPLNTYHVPDQYPLEPGQTYYMSMRPRVPSNVSEAPWGPAWTFKTDTAATVKARLADVDYGNGAIGPSQADLDKFGAANPNYHGKFVKSSLPAVYFTPTGGNIWVPGSRNKKEFYLADAV